MAALLVDLPNQCKNAQGIVPATYTVTTQQPFTGADFSTCEVCMNAEIVVGACSVALNTALQVQIEECATTNGTYTLIPGMTAAITTTNQITALRGLRNLRYVRANLVTATGTTPSAALAVALISQLKYSGTGGGTSLSPSS